MFYQICNVTRRKSKKENEQTNIIACFEPMQWSSEVRSYIFLLQCYTSIITYCKHIRFLNNSTQKALRKIICLRDYVIFGDAVSRVFLRKGRIRSCKRGGQESRSRCVQELNESRTFESISPTALQGGVSRESAWRDQRVSLDRSLLMRQTYLSPRLGQI